MKNLVSVETLLHNENLYCLSYLLFHLSLQDLHNFSLVFHGVVVHAIRGPPDPDVVQLCVDPLEQPGEHLAHVHEVENVDGNTKHSVHDGHDLPILSPRNQVAIPTQSYLELFDDAEFESRE